jgi:hypothetical protein
MRQRLVAVALSQNDHTQRLPNQLPQGRSDSSVLAVLQAGCSNSFILRVSFSFNLTYSSLWIFFLNQWHCTSLNLDNGENPIVSVPNIS